MTQANAALAASEGVAMPAAPGPDTPSVVRLPQRAEAPDDGLRVETLGELLDAAIPRRAHLVTPWLREGESALVWAAPGVGKTWLTLTLALLVAGGGEALGWRSDTPRPVLLLDGEMNGEDLRDRLAALVKGITGVDRDAARRNLRTIVRQRQDADARFPDLAEREGPTGREAGQDVLFRRIMRSGAKLVILDNLSTLAEVADENDAAAMTPILTFLLRLKQAGVAAIVVHHSGKSGTTYRGSSKLATTFEVILGLQSSEALAGHDGAAFRLDWTKFRGERTDATRSRDVRLVRQAGGGPRWEAETTAQDDVARLLAELRSCRHTSQRQLAGALGWDTSKVTRTKKRAVAEGHVTDDQWAGYLAGEAPSSDF